MNSGVKMGIDQLVAALEENPDLEASTETILPFVDGVEFFEGFIRTKKGTCLSRFKSALYRKEKNLLKLIDQKREFFMEYLQLKNQDLDKTSNIRPLGRALGVKQTQFSIVKACVEHGFLSPELPDNHSIRRVRKAGW